jgi:hypothetical protein
MAFDRTALVEAVAGRLHLHGYHPSDLAMLYGIAQFENRKLRETLLDKKVPETSTAWHPTYCRAGAPRLAFERGFSPSQARASLARIQHDGLIEVIQRGDTVPPLRRINVQALEILRRAGLSRFLWEVAKKDNSFDLGPLDWTTPDDNDSNRRWKDYLREEDLNEGDLRLQPEAISLLFQRPEKIYFSSTFARDRCYLATKIQYPNEFTLNRASDKPGRKKATPQTPYLIVSHPDGTGPPHMFGYVEPSPVPEFEPENEEEFNSEEIGDYAIN